jgi:hypothetical protein
MRFTLRRLMIATAVVAVAIAIPVGLEFARKRDAALHNEIGWNSPICGTYKHDVAAFTKKYDRTTCLDIYNRYKHRTDWEGDRIASAAMFHLARMKSPEGLQLCRQHLDSANSRHKQCAVMGILAYFDLCDDIHYTQDSGAWVQDGFNAHSPEDIYLIGTLIGSDFHYGNAPDEIINAWPSPSRLVTAWLSSNQRTAQGTQEFCTYDDMTEALKHFDPQAAEHFHQIILILKACDGKPSEEQREVMGYHRNKISTLLEPLAVLRYVARNAEYFAERKILTSKTQN